MTCGIQLEETAPLTITISIVAMRVTILQGWVSWP